MIKVLQKDKIDKEGLKAAFVAPMDGNKSMVYPQNPSVARDKHVIEFKMPVY